MQIIIYHQSQLNDFSLIVLSTSFKSFRVQFWFREFQHFRFALCSVVHVKELNWTNNMMVHFDVVLGNSYKSVRMIDRIQLPKVVIKNKVGYIHVNVRVCSHFWVEKGTNQQISLIYNLWDEKGAIEQFSLSCRFLCKMSSS